LVLFFCHWKVSEPAEVVAATVKLAVPPTDGNWFTGWVVTTGATLRVTVLDPVVATEPLNVLLTSTVYVPASPATSGVMVSVDVVAPLTFPVSVSGVPPFLHWKPGVAPGENVAVTLKVAVPPTLTLPTFDGCEVICGAGFRFAAFESVLIGAAGASVLVTLQVYCPMLPAATGLMVSVAVVAPL